MTELEQAKRALAEREERVQRELLRDTQAALAGSEPSQSEAWSIADAYDRLLQGMMLDGADLVDFAEQQVDELILETVGLYVHDEPVELTPDALRALVLSSMCVMAQLWHTRR